jgi:hypothetical protein
MQIDMNSIAGIQSHLHEFISGPAINGDTELARLLLEADQMPDCGVVVHNFVKLTNEYASLTVFLESTRPLRQNLLKHCDPLAMERTVC